MSLLLSDGQRGFLGYMDILGGGQAKRSIHKEKNTDLSPDRFLGGGKNKRSIEMRLLR